MIFAFQNSTCFVQTDSKVIGQPKVIGQACRRRCNDLCTPGTDWLICQSEGASSDTSRANQSQYSLYILFEMTFAKPDQERTTLPGYLCIDRSFFFFLFLKWFTGLQFEQVTGVFEQLYGILKRCSLLFFDIFTVLLANK